MGTELFLADGQADMTKPIISCHNLANARNTVRDEEECTRLWHVRFHGDFCAQKHWKCNLRRYRRRNAPSGSSSNGEKILPECTKKNTYWIGAMLGPYLEHIAAVTLVHL